MADGRGDDGCSWHRRMWRAPSTALHASQAPSPAHLCCFCRPSSRGPPSNCAQLALLERVGERSAPATTPTASFALALNPCVVPRHGRAVLQGPAPRSLPLSVCSCCSSHFVKLNSRSLHGCHARSPALQAHHHALAAAAARVPVVMGAVGGGGAAAPAGWSSPGKPSPNKQGGTGKAASQHPK